MQARKLALAMLALLLGLFPISTVYAYAGDVSPPTLQSSVSPSTLAGSIPSDVPWAWGLNDYGQLGDGTNTNQKIPVLVSNLSGITAVAGGRWHSLALRSDGTVWAWGRNDFGQLGDGTNTNQNTPVQVSNLSGVVAIAAGLGHSLALKSDGTVWAWGLNDYGQLGDGSTANRTTPVQVPGLSGITAIAAGEWHSLALRSDGTVWAWGRNDFGQLGNGSFSNQSIPALVSGLRGVKAIAAGFGHSLAVRSDGTVWAWGWNYYWQLGNGIRYYNRNTPVQVSGINGVKAVAAGEAHSLALRSDGTVWAWGSNFYGQVGSGTSYSPLLVLGLNGVTTIAAGEAHNLALKLDGTVWAWGWNNYGQLGNGSTFNRNTPVQVLHLNGVTAIGAGYAHSLAIQPSPNRLPVAYNDAYSTNEDVPLTVAAPGVLGNDSDPDGDTLTAVLLSAPANGSLSLNPDGSFTYTPNLNFSGADSFTYQANDNSGGSDNATVSITVTPVNDPPAAQNDSYTAEENTPLSVAPPGVLGNDIDVEGDPLTAVLLSAPANGSLSLNPDGSFTYTPNLNFSGADSFTYQANDNSGGSDNATVSITVAQVNNPPVLDPIGDKTVQEEGLLLFSISATDPEGDTLTYSASNLPAGATFDPVTRIFSWTPSYGQAGIYTGVHFEVRDGSLTDSENITITVLSTDVPRAWGQNNYGQLGDGTNTNRTRPVQVLGLRGVKAVTGGQNHSLALKPDGTVWAWGRNDFGQLGDGTNTNQNTPVQVSNLSGVVAIAAGLGHSLALKSDGTVWAWGLNNYGQLGDGSTANRTTPVQVPGLNGITAIAAGEWHSLALRSDGTVWAWGWNRYGQLGDGTFFSRTTPALVSGLRGVKAIAAGFGHSLAVRSDGTVWAWGWNYYWQLGNGIRYYNRNTPVLVSNINGVKAVAAGEAHSLALRSDGTVWAWGSNFYGQVGSGTSYSPLLVLGLNGVTTIAAGEAHNLALKLDGTVWAWGWNNYGQLGNGSFSSRSTPAPVSGLSNVSAIGAGDSHSLAIQRTSNQLPLAQDDAYSTDEDVTLAVVAPGVLGNDSDPDGDSLTAILLSSPANGSISLNPDGSFTYTPNTNFNGTDSFTYQANDGNANSDIATVTITVSPVNDPPVADAGPDQTVDEGTVVQLDGSGSYDPDNNPLTYQWNQTSGPAVTLSDSASDMPTFTAPLVSTDTTLVFELVVNDGQVDSAPDSVQVTVLANPDNDDDGIRDEVDTQPNTYSSDFSDGTTLGTITNRGDQTLTVSDEPAPAGVRIAANITGGPTPATVSIAGGSSVVTLSAGDTVIVTVGSITIEVIIGPVEVAFTGDDGTTATTTLDAGYSLTFDPTTFTFTAPGSNPGPVAAVVDGESYTINPGETATIATNTPPVAQDDVYSTDEDVTLTVAAPGVLGNDSDPDGDSLTAILLSGPANGSISLNPDGSFTYTPNTNFNGTDSFTYQANDGNANSDIATVSITVNPVNDPPMAQNDTYSTDEDVTLTVAAPGVLGNDSDPDGDSLIAILLSGPANGSISLNPDGSFTYTPNTNFNGTDSFTYQANDGNGGSDMATVTITISPVNDPPVAHAGPYQTVEQTSYAGAEVTLDGSGSYDPDGDPLTYTWTWDGNTASGVTPTVLLPLGETTITLTVHDGKLSDTSEVVITVVDTTTPPEVTADFTPIHVEEDEGTFRVEFSATDICDPDPTVVAIIAVPVPADLTDWETELKTKKEFKLEINFEEEKIEIKGPDPEETWNQIQELGGIVVTDGQIVKIELGEDEEEYEYKYKDDVLKVEAPEVRLIVTAIDGSGNVGTTTVSPTFAPEEED